MTCRDDILVCANKIVNQSGINEFSLRQILDCMNYSGTKYKESTIRTHVTSRMCANAPTHHVPKYYDFERVSFGLYKLSSFTSKRSDAEPPVDEQNYVEVAPEDTIEFGLSTKQKNTLNNALQAMINFENEFGKRLEISSISELLVADKLNLSIARRKNQPGYDAMDGYRNRYQIKFRADSTQNVDVNNFDFDHLILVNMNDEYQISGIWKLPVSLAKELFSYREKHRKYQASQKKVKTNSMFVKLTE